RPVLNPKDIGIKQLSVKAEIGLIRQKGQRFLVPQGETFHGSTVSADMNSINRYFGIHPRKDIAAFHGGCCPDGCFEFCGYRPRNEKHIFLFSLWQIRVFPEGYDFKDYDSVYATRGGFPDVDKPHWNSRHLPFGEGYRFKNVIGVLVVDYLSPKLKLKP